jgi:hypothetical protein
MADCSTRLTDIGRGMLVGWAAGCGDDDPTTNGTFTYKPLGELETRNENDTPRTVTSNTDRSGIDTDTRVIGTDTEITVSVLDAKDLVDVTTQQELRDYYDAEVEAGRDPTMWLRITDPLLNQYRYYFVVPTSFGRSAENEGNRTAEFTFTRTATNTPDNKSKQKEAFTP